MKIQKKNGDTQKAISLAMKLRKKFRRDRYHFFESLVLSLPRPLNILDVGGRQKFWQEIRLHQEPDINVVLLNIDHVEVSLPNFNSLCGDGRKMGFKDKEFDLVLSSSVIEHVGSYEQQRQMAEEVQRVGKRFILQTPNRYFPIEPHFVFPFFQFLPLGTRVFLVRHIDVGWYTIGLHTKIPNKQQAIRAVSGIRLLTLQELKELFPRAAIHKEKLFGLVKSFTVYDGWDSTSLS